MKGEPFTPLQQKAMYDHPPLSREQEYHATPEQLVLHNLRFAGRIAGEYVAYGYAPYLFAAAEDGLMRAAKKWDRERGLKFISYGVHYARQSIQTFLQKNDLIRVPQNVIRDMGRLKPYDDPKEAVKDGVVTPSQLSHARKGKAAKHLLSLDYKKDKDGFPYIDAVPNDIPMPDIEVEENEKKALLQNMLGQLTPKEADVISMIYGVGQYKDPHRLKDVGAKYDFTRERARQIGAKALKKLKMYAANPIYEDLAD